MYVGDEYGIRAEFATTNAVIVCATAK